MKTLTVKSQANVPDAEQIRSFEKESGITLPSGIKQLFLTQNPSSVEEAFFQGADEEPYFVNAFYPFDVDGTFSIQTVYNE